MPAFNRAILLLPRKTYPAFPSLNRLCCGGAGRTAEVVSHGASSMHVERRVRESTQLSRTTCIHTNREESM